MFAIVHVSLWDACVNSCICHLVAVLRIVPMCFPLKKNRSILNVHAYLNRMYQDVYPRKNADSNGGIMCWQFVNLCGVYDVFDFAYKLCRHFTKCFDCMNVFRNKLWLFITRLRKVPYHEPCRNKLWNKTYRFCQLPACANHFFLRIC